MTAPVGDGAPELVFLPLGGAGEIGMNLNLYGYGPPPRRRWLVVDLGITFAGDPPGVTVMMPDPAYLEERREDIDGILLTHAHEDHLGAVAYLWPRLRCPVYATRFALAVLSRKLAEEGIEDEVPIIEVPLTGRLRIGPFDIELITLTHSMPEPNAVALRTAAGTVLHTGDWKLDPEPVVGEEADVAALRRIGDEGVLALVCDSTNALEAGSSTGAEGELYGSLLEIVRECRQRVAVTAFASNIARLQTLGAVAAATGRRLVLAGASLRRNVAAARECGYLTDLPEILEEAAGAALPRHEALLVCTGSQGEGHAALARLVFGTHPRLVLDEGDVVIFSARVIPGHELAVGRVHNAVLRRGCRVITHREALVHVSGHPAQDELREMYRLVRPRIAVPVHGELRHLQKHAAIARSCGVEEVITVENGGLVRLAPEPAGVVETVPSGRLAVEGTRLVRVDGNLVRERTKAIYRGVVFATVAVNNRGGLLKDPLLSTVGLVEDGEEMVNTRVRDAIAKAIDDVPFTARSDEDVLREAIRSAIRHTFRELFEKKPLTYVHVVRC